MPFCRECGKEVQEDWVTCPYCSQPIGPPSSSNISLQDSVMTGDVINKTTQNITQINDLDSISGAVQNASKCPNCGSIGTIQSSCSESDCEEIAYCNVCEDEHHERGEELSLEKFWSTERMFVFVP